MGASNALRAFERYASVVPPMSMVVLAYMALVTKDSDDWPWFGLGQAAIAEFAMGRPDPDESDLRAVRRAMTPLLRSGAVTADRGGASRSGSNTTARYRLNVTPVAIAARDEWLATPDGKRRASEGARQDGFRPTSEGEGQDEIRPTSGGDVGRKPSGDVGRFVVRRRTVCGQTPDGNRPTKDEEEPRGAKGGGNVDLAATSHPPRVDTHAKIISINRPSQTEAEADPVRRARIQGDLDRHHAAEKLNARAAGILDRHRMSGMQSAGPETRTDEQDQTPRRSPDDHPPAQ